MLYNAEQVMMCNIGGSASPVGALCLCGHHHAAMGRPPNINEYYMVNAIVVLRVWCTYYTTLRGAAAAVSKWIRNLNSIEWAPLQAPACASLREQNHKQPAAPSHLRRRRELLAATMAAERVHTHILYACCATCRRRRRRRSVHVYSM